MSHPIDRFPPHSIEAEQGVLGCVFHSPLDCLDEAIAKFKAGGEVFFDGRNRTIYEHMLELSAEKVNIDPITLIARLKDRHKLEDVGGIAYLQSLPEQVPNAGNFVHYAEIVREKYILRQALAAAAAVTQRVYENDGPVSEFLDWFEQTAFRLSAEHSTVEGEVSVKQLVHQALNLLEELHRSEGKPLGLATGLHDLDRMTKGMQPGQMWIIAGRPSLGKTSLAMQIAEHVAVDDGQAVGVFSLEMPGDQLIMRMMLSRSRVSILQVSNEGKLCEGDFPKISHAAGKISGSSLYINDRGGLSNLQLRSFARRMHKKYAIKLFVVDYLQLLHSTNRRAENRQQEIADISGGIKSLAKELRVPIIVLSQLNRDADKEARRPRLSDLRESGAIEQDADLVGMLYKPQEGNKNVSEDSPVIPVNLFIAKQRNGPIGDIQLMFHRAHTRFEGAAHLIHSDDIPVNVTRSSHRPGATASANNHGCPF